MRKTFFLWLFIAAAFFANSQGKTLYTMNTVKAKQGMRSAFEEGWKKHVANFHTKDHKLNVYEIMSGNNIGTYQIVEGPISYEDMDKERSDAKEHGADLQKLFLLTNEDSRTNGTYRWDDTASFNGNVTAEKFVVTVTHLKSTEGFSTLREIQRNNKIQAKVFPNARPNFSNNYYVKLWAGSDPVHVSVRNLKEGYKQLEANFFPVTPNPNPPAPGTNPFKDTYIKDYGQEAWDARTKLLENQGNIASREVFITKLRKDLSSK